MKDQVSVEVRERAVVSTKAIRWVWPHWLSAVVCQSRKLLRSVCSKKESGTHLVVKSEITIIGDTE